MAKFYAHMLYTLCIDWHTFGIIKISHELTTSSSRIFIKILLQELAENMGLQALANKLNSPEIAGFSQGMFPKEHPRNTRFSINFFTSIGLGALTEEMREHLQKQNARA